jgi:hypothetical protein
MKTTWKGKASISETGKGLLLMTIRQEYELVVNPQEINTFLTAISQLVENKTVSNEVGFEWTLEFEAIRTLMSRISDGISSKSDITLETPWQSLPSADWLPILTELKRVFASGVSVCVTGTAPNYILEYRFGTYLLSRQIDVQSFDSMELTLRKLALTPEDVMDAALSDLKSQRFTAIETLNMLAGGTDLTGTPLGGLAIALVVAAADSQTPLIAEVKAMSISRAVIFAVLAGAGAAIKGAASAYKDYMEAEKARAERDRARYELERQQMRDRQNREARPVREVDVSAGGPAYDHGIDRAGRTC